MKLSVLAFAAMAAFFAGGAIVDPAHLADWAIILQPAMAAWIAIVSHRIKTLEKEVDALRLKFHTLSNFTQILSGRISKE